MAKTPSFITELRLKVNREQERRLLVRLEVARQVYNACLGESLKRLKLMRKSREYQAARKLPGRAEVGSMGSAASGVWCCPAAVSVQRIRAARLCETIWA